MPVEPPPPFGPTGDTIAGGGPFVAATGGGGSTPNYPSVGTGTPDVYTGPPAPSVVNSVRDVRERVTQNAVPVGTVLPIILGRGRVEGRVIHVIEGNPEILIVAFAAGPNNAFEAHYFNGQEITSGSDGVTITEHLGAYNQSVDSIVSTYLGNYRLPGLTYAVYSIDGGDSFSAPSPFFGQVTSIVADLKGIELYDPRENRIIQSEDFSSTRWTCSGTFPTRVTGITDRFNYTGASRWTFGASGPYTIYRDTSGLSLATSDPVTVAIDVRSSTPFTCNLTAKKTSGSSTSTAISVKTSWRRYTVTHPAGTGTGNARIQLDGIPSSSVIEVRFASVQIQAEDFGHTITTASAVTVGTRWAENPMLGLLFLETDEVNGAGGTPTSKVNMASWGKAAALCDGVQADGTATYSIGLVLSTEGDASRYREAIRGTCAGEIFWEDGLLCSFVDSYQPNDPVLQFSTKSDVKSPLIPAKGPRFGLLSAPSRPTHVVVQFHDAAKGYSASSAQADHPLLKAGGVKYQEAVYSYDAIVSEAVANRVAWYTEGRARLCELGGSFTVPFVGIRLTRGMLVEITTEDGLAAQQVIVDDFEALDSGEYVITACHEYDTALYTFSSLTADTPPSTSFPPMRPAPPIVELWTPSTGGYTVTALVDASHAMPVHYPAARWSSSGLTSFDASKINDGSLATVGAIVATAGTQWIQVDLGAGNSAEFTRVDVVTTAANAASPPIEYSDNGSSWTTIGSTGRYVIASWAASVSDNLGFVKTWGSAGAHRYWRLNPLAIGAAYSISELQWLAVGTSLQPNVREIGIKSGLGLESPLWKTLAVTPQNILGGTFLIDVTPITLRTQSPSSTDSQVTTDAVLDCAYASGVRSAYSFRLHRFAFFAPAVVAGEAAHVIAQAVATSPSIQSANYAIDGKARSAQVEADPQAAGTVALEVDNVASPTVSLAEFKLNNVVQLDIDKKGSLRTDESARVAPWVEARVECTTLTTITSTTAADVTGATITFTPASDVRAYITAAWDVDVSVLGDSFIGELVVNGTPEAPQVFLKLLTTNERVMASQVYAITLTGGTSYTIKLQAKLNASGATYHVNSTNTGFVILGIGRF